MKRIQEFSDEDLINELEMRYDHFIMAGRKDQYKGHNDARRKEVWSGDCDVCLGLTRGVAQDIENIVWGSIKEEK